MKFRFEPVKIILIVIEIIVIFLAAKVGINHIGNTAHSYKNAKSDVIKYTERKIDIDGLQEEVERLKRQVEEYQSNVNNSQDQSTILRQIQNIAEKTGINRIESVKPLDDIYSNRIFYKQFELALSGEYLSVLKYINQLERSSPPFLITSMTLRPISQSAQYIIIAKLNLIQGGIIEQE